MRLSAALYRLLDGIGASSGLAETCSTLDGGLREILPFHAMAVFLLVGGRLRPVYTSPGMLARPGPSGAIAGEEIASRVAATHRPVFNSEPQSAPGEPAGGGCYGSVLAVPLGDGGEVEGVLSLYSRERNVFSAQDLGALLWIRKDLARVIGRALRGGVGTAPAGPVDTGADEAVAMIRREISRDARQMFWVLLCHLKRLGALGARFGEAARTRLLLAVFAGLRRTCRSEDGVARDGDDFILTLHDLHEPHMESKKVSVAALAEGISVAQLGDRFVPVQVGAACFPLDASQPRQLMALAASRLRLVSIPTASFAENLMHLAAALETAASTPEDGAALQPVQIHSPLSGEAQE